MAIDREDLMRRYAPRLAGVSAAVPVTVTVQGIDNALAASVLTGTGNQIVVTSRPTQQQPVQDPAREPAAAAPAVTTVSGTWSPVITTVGSRTILTAPATTERSAMWGSPPNPSRHMVWMQGRFVGAERPNRNNAFWSTADLELGKPSVAHGPLNWLHEDRHIIGAIADATFVPATTQPEAAAEAGGTETADWTDLLKRGGAGADATISDPHISALSAIWSWVYPDEASVVQMASDSGVLAYSMECISESVQCVGDGGCGSEFGYMQYAKGDTCDHLKERSTVRRLVNPTFLGGAVIVPPSRPGWADANASILRQAASVAEKAFDQAGRPDIPAATWEQMMAGVLTFAGRPDAQ